VVAVLFRAIDALKTFDIIFVMTQGGPANASETINILLFNQAFSYFNMGYASSMAVALFAVVMGASLILIKVRRSTHVVKGGRSPWLSTARFYGSPHVHAADGLRLLLDDHALAQAAGRGHGLPAVVRALQRQRGRLPRGVHQVSVLPLHVEQPGGGGGCTLLGLAVGLPAAYSIARLAPAAAGRGHPGRRASFPASRT
jgi:hypothetical protein